MQKPYLKDRLIDQHDGFVVIVPNDSLLPTPLGCDVCGFVFRSQDDESSFNEFGCCDRCSRLWASSRKEAWKEGWRPSAEQVKEAESDRMPLNYVFDID